MDSPGSRVPVPVPARADHDHVEFPSHGDLPGIYTENSSPDENSPPKTGHITTDFMIAATFRQPPG
jgi:hypothetical protein